MGATIQSVVDKETALYPQAILTPIGVHPEVAVVLDVNITSGMLPAGVVTPRASRAKVYTELADARKPSLLMPKLGQERPRGDDPCPICFHDMGGEDGGKLPCGHAAHLDCILPWLDQNPSCPICRDNVVESAKRQR